MRRVPRQLTRSGFAAPCGFHCIGCVDRDGHIPSCELGKERLEVAEVGELLIEVHIENASQEVVFREQIKRSLPGLPERMKTLIALRAIGNGDFLRTPSRKDHPDSALLAFSNKLDQFGRIVVFLIHRAVAPVQHRRCLEHLPRTTRAADDVGKRIDAHGVETTLEQVVEGAVPIGKRPAGIVAVKP